MPSFTVKVPNGDEGEDLGEYQSDYLPRVGDPFYLWHPKVCGSSDSPFEGRVAEVTHEAFHESHRYAKGGNKPIVVSTTVWLTEEAAAPTIYCDCSEEERAKWKVEEGRCENCGDVRSEEP